MSDPQGPKRKKLADGGALREEKRRKWEAKQQRINQAASQQKDLYTWFQEHSAFATLVTEEDVDDMRSYLEFWGIAAPGDESVKYGTLAEKLDPYLDIQETKEIIDVSEQGSGRLFIAEGTETVRVLLQQCEKKRNMRLDRIEIKSIFVKPSVLFDPPVNLLSDVLKALPAELSAEEATKIMGTETTSVSPGFQVLVGRSEAVLSKVAGFPISRGALACGRIPLDRNEEWLNDYLRKTEAIGRGEQVSCRMLALDGICDTANLGSMIRTASALGVNVVVLSNDTCDAWYRKAIRVSMGHVFLVPIVRVQSLANFLTKWKSITSFAAVVQKEDSVALHNIPPSGVPYTWCCVFGNEGNGISKEVMQRCSQKIRIEMTDGVDSLSVPIACGILLHGLRERER